MAGLDVARVDGVSRTEGDVRQGPLGRAATVVYWFVVVEALLLLTAGPGLVASLFLEPGLGSLPLYVLCAAPLGPAVAAAFFAWRVFLRDRDPSPAPHFWRGYRLNALDALRVWVPSVVLLAVLATNAASDVAGGLPPTVFLGLAAVLLLWTVRMLGVTSAFAFRWRDAARISAFTLTAQPLRTLGLLSLLVLTGGVIAVTSDAVGVLLASVLTFLAVRNEAPVLDVVRERFVEDDAG